MVAADFVKMPTHYVTAARPEAVAAIRATTGSVGWVKDRVGYLVYPAG